MTREEEKAIVANKYYPDDINGYCAFLYGADWSDKHPKNLWHDASEEPECEYEFICQDTLGDVWLTKRRAYEIGWEERAIRECIIRWAYVKDLLPKGGEI